VPLYVAHYETACMTRQFLEELARQVEVASGACRSERFVVSLTGGHLVWVFSAPDRSTLERWLGVLRMSNFQWLARVDFEGRGGQMLDR
jgi:hypothetical protein